MVIHENITVRGLLLYMYVYTSIHMHAVLRVHEFIVYIGAHICSNIHCAIPANLKHQGQRASLHAPPTLTRSNFL